MLNSVFLRLLVFIKTMMNVEKIINNDRVVFEGYSGMTHVPIICTLKVLLLLQVKCINV